MNAKLIVIGALVGVASINAKADDITLDNRTSNVAPSGLTRAQVKAEVLAARRAGTLLPAGEAPYLGLSVHDTMSTLTRTEVKADLVAARQAGQLLPAGEAAQVVGHPITPSTLARADVKAEVLAARRNGELLPAGEGYYPDHKVRGYYPDSAVHQAQSERPFKTLANLFRRSGDETQ